MNKLELDFSFKKDISRIKGFSGSTVSSSLPKDFSSCGLSLNNSSRFQEKKVLRKLREQDVLNRIQMKLKCFADNQVLLKDTLKFRPVKSKKNKIEKENK